MWLSKEKVGILFLQCIFSSFSGEVSFKQTCKGITLKNNDFLNPNIMSQISKMQLQRTHPSPELQKLKNVEQQRFHIQKNHSISVGSIEKVIISLYKYFCQKL